MEFQRISSFSSSFRDTDFDEDFFSWGPKKKVKKDSFVENFSSFSEDQSNLGIKGFDMLCAASLYTIERNSMAVLPQITQGQNERFKNGYISSIKSNQVAANNFREKNGENNFVKHSLSQVNEENYQGCLYDDSENPSESESSSSNNKTQKTNSSKEFCFRLNWKDNYEGKIMLYFDGERDDITLTNCIIYTIKDESHERVQGLLVEIEGQQIKLKVKWGQQKLHQVQKNMIDDEEALYRDEKRQEWLNTRLHINFNININQA